MQNRAVGRSENPEGRGSSNVEGIICPLPPPVQIGSTDLPKSGGTPGSYRPAEVLTFAVMMSKKYIRSKYVH